jgi:hypothetical protein
MGTTSQPSTWIPIGCPKPADRSLALMVVDGPCNPRETAATVVADEDRIVVTVLVKGAGVNACPGGLSRPLTVVLDEPVGDRAIFDGSRYPLREMK